MVQRGDIKATNLFREIHEQPRVLSRLLKKSGDPIRRIADELARRDIGWLFIAARGTSDNAATYAKYLFASVNRLPTSLAAPSLYTVYRRPPRLANALVIGISQSGEALDVLEVVKKGKAQGNPTLAITNNPSSPLAKAADFSIDIDVGTEQSVAATKSYTAQLTALAALSSCLSGDEARMESLKAVPDLVRQALSLEEEIAQVVQRYRYMDSCAVLARGFNYANAFEFSLKLKELTYVVAEPYSSVDFLHGPIAIIETGFPVFLIAPKGKVSPGLLDLTSKLAERGSEIVSISNDRKLLSKSTRAFRLPGDMQEWFSPIPAIVPAQLFSMYLSAAKGYHPDRPRGLKKITLTR